MIGNVSSQIHQINQLFEKNSLHVSPLRKTSPLSCFIYDSFVVIRVFFMVGG